MENLRRPIDILELIVEQRGMDDAFLRRSDFEVECIKYMKEKRLDAVERNPCPVIVCNGRE